MPLPPLYKFMDVPGAKLTLGNRTFRHAKPSTFNDVEDLTIQSLFVEPLEDALKIVSEGMTQVILKHLGDPPTCNPPLRDTIAQLQAIYKAYPQAAAAAEAEVLEKGVAGVFDLDVARAQAADMIKFVNDHMQRYRVFCVTTDIKSKKVWQDYTVDHSGVAFRVLPSPDLQKDSHLTLFKAVSYKDRRPPLYANTLDFIPDSLFGDLDTRVKTMIDTIIYTKTLQWQDEKEYRVAVPLREDEEPWETLSFHPEEIAELYLGAKMRLADMALIIRQARRINPAIAIFQTELGEKDDVAFRPL